MNKELFESEYKFEIFEYDHNDLLFFKYPLDIKWEIKPLIFLTGNCGAKLLNSFKTDKYQLYCFGFPKNLILHRLNYEQNYAALQIDLILTDESPLLEKWNKGLSLKIEKEGKMYYYLREFLFSKNSSQLLHTNFFFWDWDSENKEKPYLWYKNNKTN